MVLQPIQIAPVKAAKLFHPGDSARRKGAGTLRGMRRVAVAEHADDSG
jgi:hypothetical protein